MAVIKQNNSRKNKLGEVGFWLFVDRLIDKRPFSHHRDDHASRRNLLIVK